MEWFNVVHIQPPGDRVTLGHWDVARLLYFALESLGKHASLQVNRIERATNIIVGYEHFVSADRLPAGIRYIPYQLEQLGPGGQSLSPIMLESLRRAAEVWDYTPANIAALKQAGISNIKLLPLGYHEKLATIPHRIPDVDVLHYGLLNDRRRHILDALAQRCSTQCLEYVYGDQRDEWIARSKLILNLHFYPTKTAEQVRISYVINNARCVVTETSPDDPLGRFCAVAPYEQLVETCLRLIADDAERQRIATVGGNGFRQLPMTEYIRRVLPV